MLTLGIVIPVFNEEQIIDRLCERVAGVLDNLDLPAVVCLVDDGSTDGTLSRIQRFGQRDPRFRYLSFSRNFGHQTAVLAGLRELDADVYVVMDGDLQDPPELIPELLVTWRRGYEVVYCVRRSRKEHVLKRWAYAAFYRLLSAVSYLRIPLDTGDFCLIDRVIVEHLRRMPEHNHFIRGLRTWVGYRQTAYHYDRDARVGGTSKYSFRKLLALAYDGLISFSFVPLRTVMKLGFLVSLVSFLSICVLIVQKLVFGIPLAGWTSTAVLILFMGGIQLLTLGVVGEYVARIFDEVKDRPLYIIRQSNLLLRSGDGDLGLAAGVSTGRGGSKTRSASDGPVETTLGPTPRRAAAAHAQAPLTRFRPDAEDAVKTAGETAAATFEQHVADGLCAGRPPAEASAP